VRPDAWKDIRDLACVIGGPDPSLPPTAPYSDAHYQALVADPVMTALIEAKVVFIDSITAMGRHSFRWAEQQPEAISDRGKKDLRAVYGLHARTMLGALNQFQRARAKSVIFVGILERVIDDFNVGTWQAQIEGAKTRRELLASSIKSSPINSSIVGMARTLSARFSARALTHGPIPRKIDPAFSRSSKSPTSALSSRNSPPLWSPQARKGKSNGYRSVGRLAMHPGRNHRHRPYACEAARRHGRRGQRLKAHQERRR
jgi:hypothetical protein